MFFSNFIPCHDYRYPFTYTSHVKNTRAGSSRLSIRHVIIQPCNRKNRPATQPPGASGYLRLWIKS